MTELSEADCLYIQRQPLQPKIGHLRAGLQKVAASLAPSRDLHNTSPARSQQSTETEEDTEPLDDGDDVKDVLLELLSALLSHRVAKRLQSRDTGTVVGELGKLVNLLDSDRINIAIFTPLVRVVTEDPLSDIQIWKTVIQVISTVKRQTPPPSRPSFSGTPRTVSSGSHQGSEQTKRLLNPVLRRELQGCVYEHVNGFYDKYFEGTWVESAEDTIKKLGSEHKDGRWLGFPTQPTEADVWEWWSNLQEKYLAKARGVYYTTSSKTELTGTDTERQLDLLMKHRDASTQGKHNWSDVRVVGEHKCSQTNANEKFLQLSRYVRDVFKTQPTRRFVHAFLLLEMRVEPFVFDRSGAYSGVPFDIHEEPDRFIKLFLGYSMMSDEELGLDIFVEQQEDRRYVTVQALDEEADTKRLELEPQPIFMLPAIVCRGTSCYRTVDNKNVVKFSWRPANRPSEVEHFRHAHARGVKGIVQLVGHEEITSVAELRQGLKFTRKRTFRDMVSATDSFSQSQSFTAGSRVGGLSLQESKRKSVDSCRRPSKKSRSNSQASNLSQEVQASQESESEMQPATQASAVDEDDAFRNRILTCIAVSPAGRPLDQFRDIPEMLRGLRDAIKAHNSLFIDGRTLHRDISPNNIIITDPKCADGFHGMLIDMDLSTQVDRSGKNQRSGAAKMTGTLKYMAIEVLELAFRDARSDLDHTYRHDLESFFYVFLDLCINCDMTSGQRRKSDSLRAWYIGSYKEITYAKRGQMGKGGFEGFFLAEFSSAFHGLKDLARALRSILFLEGDIYTGTPEDASLLYGRMIKAFEDAIEKL